MIRIRAPSRLHFGLLSLPGAASPGRRFGSVGLMTEAPGLRLAVTPAPAWSAEGPLAERALAFARRFLLSLEREAQAVGPHRLVVEQAPPEHAGLGSGTQLGLAVAQALAAAAGLAQRDAVALAQRVGRGERSAVGVYGFAQGGFLVDAGRGEREAIAPLVARADFPEEWRLVLAVPPWGKGRHGHLESQAFQQLASDAGRTDVLCRLVLLGLLPALAERDLKTFGEAAYEFNARVGEAFAPIQGGIYANPRVAELVAVVRQQGVQGVGQSSWGPTVFAVLGDQERASDLAERVRQHFALEAEAVFVTRASNKGAEMI
jgi:beta-RFAP synthase